MARATTAIAKCRIAMAVAVGMATLPLVTAAQQAKPSAAPAVYSDAQAARGAAVYAENCAQCHDATLQGSDRASALIGPSFVERWVAGKPLSELFDYMRLEMPMNSPGGLSPRHNADLVAFLLQKSGYPAGKTDLPGTSAQLAGVKVGK